MTGPSPQRPQSGSSSQPSQSVDRPRGALRALRRLRLLLQACRLHALAQGLTRAVPLTDVRQRMLQLPVSLPGVEPAEAVWAADLAVRIQRRLFGMLDTCLVRSLVAGALVAVRPNVDLRIGVRRSSSPEELLQAHAWLTVDGVEVLPSAAAPQERFEEILVLPMERAR